MGIENIYLLLIFIVPGFLANEVYRSVYPAKKISDLDKTIWSLLYTIFILAALQLLGYKILEEFSDSFSIVFYSIIPILMGVWLGGMLIIWRKLRSLMPFLEPSSVSVWSEVLEKPKSCWVVVALADGVTHYMGWVDLYSSDPNEQTQELFLKDVMLVDKQRTLIQRINGDGIYLKSDMIMSLEIWT